MAAQHRTKFKDIQHTRYLSHIHTTYGDGSETIDGYCRWADEHGYQSIVFSEHVGCRMEIDFNAYCDEIDRAREAWPQLSLWTGVEARVLSFGNIDILEEILPQVEVLFIACHGFPGDIERYRHALETVFRDERWKGIPRIWAHPGRYFKVRGWTDEAGSTLKELINLAISEDILIENNLRESLPPVWLLKTLPISEIIVGYGARTIADLRVR